MSEITNIFDQLKRDEGVVYHVYKDSLGILTAGVGHNIESHHEGMTLGEEVSPDLVDLWLHNDVQNAETQLAMNLPWTKDMDEVRHAVLVNMCFNLGIKGLMGFHNTLAMIEAGNYGGAAEAMLESKWAHQVGPRATRLASQLQKGEWV